MTSLVSDVIEERTLEQVFGREVSRRHALEREHSRLATKYQPDRREQEEGGERVWTAFVMFNILCAWLHIDDNDSERGKVRTVESDRHPRCHCALLSVDSTDSTMTTH